MSTPLLYLAWRGAEDDGNLFWSTSDGSSWSTKPALHDRASLLGPTLAVFDGRLFMAWRGVSGDHQIYWSTYDATTDTWSPQQDRSDIASYRRPALTAFEGSLYLAWRSASDGDDLLWWTTYDEAIGSFGQPHAATTLGGAGSTTIPPPPRSGGSRTGPALAAFRGKLYMSWCAPGEVNISWAVYDPDAQQWAPQPRLTDRASHDGPALAVVGGHLFMVWRGPLLDTSDKHLYWSALDDPSRSWSPQQQLMPPQPPAKPPPPRSVGWLASRVRPGLAAFEDELVLACVGERTLAPGGGTPDSVEGDPTGDNVPGQDGDAPDLRIFYATSGAIREIPNPAPNWMTLLDDSAGNPLLTGGEPAVAVYAHDPGSLRSLLLNHGFEPRRGLAEFRAEFWPSQVSARTLMRS